MINTTQQNTTSKPARTVRKTTRKSKSAKPVYPPDSLVGLLEKLSVKRPPDFDWKEDYIQALEEKYAGVR